MPSENSSNIMSENRINKVKINTPNTHIHDHSLSWIGTGTTVKMAGLN